MTTITQPRLRTTPGSNAGGRATWIDTLRGLAIFLVIIYHGVSIPWQYDADSSHLWDSINAFFTALRMPMLFLLSGVLLPRSLAKPLGTYFGGKARALLWPLVIWTPITIAIVPRLSPDRFRAWVGGEHLWFLWVLFGCFLLAVVMRKLPFWASSILCFLTAIYVGPWLLDLWLVYHVFWHAGFFFLGAWLATAMERMVRLPSWVPTVVFVAGLAGASTLVVLGRWQTHQVSTAVVAIATVAALTVLACRWQIHQPFFAWLGRHSMVPYLTHVAALHVAWWGVALTGLTNPWLTLPLLFVGTGALIALLMWARPHTRWLYEFPARRRPVSQTVQTR